MLPDTFPWWGLLALTTAAFTDVVTDLLPAGLVAALLGGGAMLGLFASALAVARQLERS